MNFVAIKMINGFRQEFGPPEEIIISINDKSLSHEM